jgi:serine/threonine protein kinase
MSAPAEPRRTNARQTAARTEAQGPGRSAQPAQADKHDLSFLDPPQKPGELGRLARYRILEVLGVGGMGMVFRALDPDLQRPVALKVVRPDQASETTAVQRFLREARALAAVRDEHVITVYQVGQHHGVAFLAMELLEGETLEDRLRREGKLPLADVLRIGRQTALGLAAAHAQDMVHRDVKPANIWLEPMKNVLPAETQFRVKLLDFGIARSKEDVRVTQTGAFMGTAGYLSPEQARSQELDPRSDLFSLGCVLYRLCAGRLPFAGATLTARLTSLAVDEAIPLSEAAPDVPRALAELIHELLAKDPDQRPESAAVVAERLRRLEEPSAPTEAEETAPEQPVRSPRPRRAARAWWQNQRLWLWAAVVLGLALGAGIGYRFWSSRRSGQRQPTEEQPAGGGPRPPGGLPLGPPPRDTLPPPPPRDALPPPPPRDGRPPGPRSQLTDGMVPTLALSPRSLLASEDQG